MWKLLTLVTILYTVPATASVLTYMNALQPAVNHTEIARIIVKYAEIYHIDPYIIVAIAAQESSLLPTNHRRRGKIITDYGLLQINRGMLKARGINPARLLLDPDYYMHEAIKFLSEKMLMCKGSKNSWGCYHSKTPSLRKAYELRVIHYLRLADAYRKAGRKRRISTP